MTTPPYRSFVTKDHGTASRLSVNRRASALAILLVAMDDGAFEVLGHIEPDAWPG